VERQDGRARKQLNSSLAPRDSSRRALLHTALGRSVGVVERHPTPRSAAPSQDAGRVLNFACSPRQRTEARSRPLDELSYNLSILERPTSSSATGRATPNASPPNALRSPSCSSSFTNAGAVPSPTAYPPSTRYRTPPRRPPPIAPMQRYRRLLILLNP
jgi:hypothetical protein